MDLKYYIKDVPDFPEPGILFRDITPLLAEPQAWSITLDRLTQLVAFLKPDYIVGIESRGFIFAAPLALDLGAGFVPVRKSGKLPRATFQQQYSLEYRTDTLEIHQDCFKVKPGGRVLVVDDVIATGGTAKCAGDLVGLAGGTLVGFCFLIELTFLAGRDLLPPELPCLSLLTY
ncbi:adenine phosphoribosyltransferase [Candidatus Cyanaurora vandensis]|uniref:adenine phosphoribosyltransferase n=1 Tax=Candidatus Cyanaurora vandensis TaxID=2714958 RepID=UPI00257A5E2E|nr:adenine phosphoribosyltransferase [Candidatus Cyanaurora vandensis]